MALFKDFRTGEWEACATEFRKGKSTSVPCEIVQMRSQANCTGNGEFAQNMHDQKPQHALNNEILDLLNKESVSGVHNGRASL